MMTSEKEPDQELGLEARLSRLEALVRQQSQTVAHTVHSLSAKLEAITQFLCTHPSPLLPRPDMPGIGPGHESCPPEPSDQVLTDALPTERQVSQNLHQTESSDSSHGVQRPDFLSLPELQSSMELRQQSARQTALGPSSLPLSHHLPHQPPSPASQLSQPHPSQPQHFLPHSSQPQPLQPHLSHPHPSLQPHPHSLLSSETRASETGAHSHLGGTGPTFVQASSSTPHEAQQTLREPRQEVSMGSKGEPGRPMVGSHMTDVLTYNVHAHMEQQSPFTALAPYKDAIVHSAKPYPEDWISNTPVGPASDDTPTPKTGGGDGSASGATARTASDTASSALGSQKQCPSNLTPGPSQGYSSLGLDAPHRQGQAKSNQDTSLEAAGGKASGQRAGQDDTAAEERGPASKTSRNAPTDEKSAERKNPEDSEGDAARLLGRMGMSTNDVLKEAVQRAFTEERPSPRAVTAQTVLCLDCSPSIGPQGLSAMKAAALAFVSGIEEVAERFGLDENLGVVTFGPSTEVAQHLTIDYQAVREAIEKASLGGRSPLLEALIICLAAFHSKGGPLSIGLVHTLRPRVIIFTDGIATQTDSTQGPENFSTTPTHRRIALIQCLRSINSHKTMPSPIIWVPVGKADKGLMGSLAVIGGGKLVEPQDVAKECSYYRFHDAVAKGYLCIRDKDASSYDDERLSSLLDAIVVDFTGIDKAELLSVLKAKLDRRTKEKRDPHDFDNLAERDDLPDFGTRVVRGPGWTWANQDGGCVGTVIGHCPDAQWVYVRWDHGGYNRYTFLSDGKGDVKEVDSPRILKPGDPINVGVRLTRGPDWEAGEEDGGAGSVGVVVRVKNKHQVRVRWPSGVFGKYSWDADGKKYLILVDKEEDMKASQKEQEADSATTEDVAGDLSASTKTAVWWWCSCAARDEWTEYDDATRTKLENMYIARPQSTCLIERNGSRRVSFKKMEEWKIEEGSERTRVRRRLV